ncbi:hypothetical protein DPMN_042215 [Dreissena polymorpha]|uniref:Uncharacterized protein n=1 Tax=Dreissena polymorpha TaxID=45954 RepID=A0A9D4D0G5_DREPO|nr:hypothetical protein DPMN_042215 [Dreissena polymorpha]
MMSVGDDPMNNGKVQCLHSAVIGYSPLIFGLESTSGYEELLEKCEDVWNELTVNPKLPEQLVNNN